MQADKRRPNQPHQAMDLSITNPSPPVFFIPQSRFPENYPYRWLITKATQSCILAHCILNFVNVKWPKFLHGRNYGKVGRLTIKRNGHNNQSSLPRCKSIRHHPNNMTSAYPMHMSIYITVTTRYNHMKYVANVFCLYIVDRLGCVVFVNLKGFLVVFSRMNPLCAWD